MVQKLNDLRSKITVPYVLESKHAKHILSATTAYDATFANIVDNSGIDIILVGDSVGTVIQGQPNTIGVTLDEMVYHTKLVTRTAKRALVVADLPFLTYQISAEEALRNAGRLIQSGGAQAVKLEGGHHVATTVAAITKADIPVMGHIGLTPQSYHRMGGFRVQGRDASSAKNMLKDAEALQQAGAFAVVLEGIPKELAAEITEFLDIPTIGIGAGPQCDGQILVLHDLLGLTPQGKTARFVKSYADLGSLAEEALSEYITEVQERLFPDDEHSYSNTTKANVSVAK